jgi:3-hydroxybutyryl-CoA dehydrogenase
MKIAVITDECLKQELLLQGLHDTAIVEWSDDINTVSKDADAYIDLLFDTAKDKRKQFLSELPADVIIVNDVIGTTETLPGKFIRINAWPTFLKRPITEASYNSELHKQKCENIFSLFNKQIEWTKDIPGFITARVVCTIINEAFYSLPDNESSREEIDTAMKLGTNYPYGPFEWSGLIGAEKICSLLDELSKTNKRYTVCDLLKKECSF